MTPVKGTNNVTNPPLWDGFLASSMSSTFVESLSSIMFKTQQAKCLISMRIQMEKEMVCDNDNNKGYNSKCNNEMIKGEEWM